MSFAEIILVSIGVLAVAFLMVTIVRRISAYYRNQFNMSVWAGVFLLAIASVLVVFAIVHYERPNVILIILGGVLAVLTGALDIIHAGVWMGLLAFLFQIVLAVTFIAFVIVVIVFYVVHLVRRRGNNHADTIIGTSGGLRNSVALFFRFFVP